MRVARDVPLWTCTEKSPLAQGRRPEMTRDSARLSLLVVAIVFFSSALPNLAPAQTVSFIAPGDFPVGTHPQSVAVGDFNGDGRPDLAVANFGSNTVSVLLGIGDGSFQPARTFAAGTSPLSVAVGDFNGDGRPDLAVANFGSNTVSVLLGIGDGTFQPALTFAAGTQPVFVAVGDLNGDGRPDLAVANTGSDNVSVLLGIGDGTFQPALTLDRKSVV